MLNKLKINALVSSENGDKANCHSKIYNDGQIPTAETAGDIYW